MKPVTSIRAAGVASRTRVKEPKCASRLFGQGLDVGPGDGVGEQQLQEFVILQGPGPALEEAAPQALPVAVVMGLGRLGWHDARPQIVVASIFLLTYFLNKFKSFSLVGTTS